MNQFANILPEEQGKEPLERLRLWDCYRLADAYGIPYEKGCIKDEIMIPLRSAQGRGVFNSPPKYPEKLHPPKLAPATEPLVEGEVRVPSDILEVKWGAPKYKWCIYQGKERIKTGFATKEDAQMELDNGLNAS